MTPIDSGLDPKWAGEPQYEVLVAVLSYSPELRVLFENQLVAGLRKEGVNAVASFTVMPRVTSLNAETFTRFLEADPSLAVLFTQATSVQKEQTNSNPDGSNVFSGLLGGGQWDTTFIAIMESALYIQGQTTAVWWNRVRLEAKETKVDQVAEQFVRNAIKSMQRDGAISRLK